MGGDRRIPVGVLGATGSVGQRFVQLLHRHPWFRVAAVTASERSEGKRYGDAVRWVQNEPLASEIAELPVLPTAPGLDVKVAFSALDSGVAGSAETEFAESGVMVFSNAKNHRMDPDVPLLVPEVNPDHLALLEKQSFPKGGGIVTNPNCSTIGLVIPLRALHEAFGVNRVHVVTLQALSGAGLPGVASMEIMDNVVPFIDGEEEKLETETRKILGLLNGQGVEDAEIVVSAQCTRVPVLDGHLEMVSIGLDRPATPEEAMEVMASFRGVPQEMELPSAPKRPVHLLSGKDHPQPRLHRDTEGGMAVSVGRVRPCPLLDLRMAILSHNTIRGAAGGALLCAELALAQGWVPGMSGPGREQTLTRRR
ncbi:MAG: aspartate-semialdehyde dehydrogenase [Gemmatimonadetes bacterium]|nr:aspartate-semialdehyde dehydrogenase [Gemmatimonadota bacterium]